MVDENDAAYRIVKATGGDSDTDTEPKEGRRRLHCEGLLSLRQTSDLLTRVNSVGEMTLATLHDNKHVHKGKVCSRNKSLALVIDDAKLKEMEKRHKLPTHVGQCHSLCLSEDRDYRQRSVHGPDQGCLGPFWSRFNDLARGRATIQPMTIPT